MKRALAFALSMAMPASVFAQTDSTTPKPATTHHKSSAKPVSSDIQELKDAIAAQQQQIQQLQQQVQSRDQAIQTLQTQVGQAQSTAQQAQQAAAAAANQQSPQSADAIAGLQHDVTDLKTLSANSADALQDTQKRVSGLESPLAIHYKGITITPGGFLAAETVWRPHATTSDINTPFNSIPLSGNSAYKNSEFYGTGRQSRISMLAQGKLDNMSMTGYLEADFLGVGVTSNNNESNSYVLRQRQVWGQAALNSGWTFTGGQMWSLVTETKVGLDNRTEALPMTIDPQYTVGFSWARQYGFRVTKNFNNKAWLGLSVENSQETLTAHGNATNFLLGSPGNNGGAYNASASTGCTTNATTSGGTTSYTTFCGANANYSWNESPDFIAKLAFQPGFGHYEVFGLVSPMRDRVFPNATATPASASGAYNAGTTGAGYGANGRWSLDQKHIDLGIHYLGGNGVGRYGTAGLPDLTVHPNGTLAMIHSNQALGTLEWHSQKWDWYGNFGAEFASRNWNLNSKGVSVGYGAPGFANTGCSIEVLPLASNGFLPGSLGKCTGDTRDILEATAGFWYKPYNGPKGRLQFGPQYSYLVRNTWEGTGGSPHAIENMVFTSFRYYLP